MLGRAQHGAPRNYVAVLARREATGRQAFRPSLERESLTLRQVFRHEEGGVLLGFSSDGNFLGRSAKLQFLSLWNSCLLFYQCIALR
jgi:hypothetical protein